MLNFLRRTELFHDLSEEELSALLSCLAAERRRCRKGEVILRAGEVTTRMGLVLSGRVQIENDDPWGNRSVLMSVGAGSIFAETYACLGSVPLMVSAVATEECEVLFLSAAKLLSPCERGCGFHQKVIKNLLTLCAEKNLSLSRRMFHTSAKTIRARVSSYLSFEAKRRGSERFAIPFDRQQLADYLGVDRSALSHELGKMQKEGLLTVKKNRFELIKIEEAME
ncbi:MAG: Crp/Fnr family transcriptional regulator [Clostridia bacterium]|nr:Crp/Fnr family transcriptional regulator [Clostridia bacterium]